MKQRQFAFTAIRVLAIYFLVAGIGRLMDVVAPVMLSGSDAHVSAWAYLSLVMPGLVYVAASVLLWSKAEGLVLRITQGQVEDAAEALPATRFASGELYKLALSLTGVILIVLTLPTLASTIIQLLQVNETSYTVTQPFLYSNWAVIMECIVKLGLGLLLIIKTQVIFGWVGRTFQQVRTNNQ
ncbi:hypothetical protein BBD42_00960 [Paenibacillus sp. BIHB 4019]|uniref:Uncharacterized protein n=1 Tax=Paenibacillus sp. BIHB 4019 TaxID=1870819 RepID=A0A1B2DBY1_9BACL|nr:hypothetical protein [Paenibacillus sp. BIHB 4019]ANY65205.1 hypothetical protein BBD42_00960 [Paenibacillus sp. BIHB 4019]